MAELITRNGADGSAPNRGLTRPEHRCKRQLDRRREPRQDLIGHRCIGAERPSQIALHRIPGELGILHGQRPVQAHLFAQLRYRLRIGPRPKNLLRRIATGRMHHEEDNQRHPDQHGDRDQYSLQHVASHRLPAPSARHLRPSVGANPRGRPRDRNLAPRCGRLLDKWSFSPEFQLWDRGNRRTPGTHLIYRSTAN